MESKTDKPQPKNDKDSLKTLAMCTRRSKNRPRSGA